MPRFIIAWSSIGGMLGRSYGPAVIVSSCFDESTATVTVAGGAPAPGPATTLAASIRLHSIMQRSATGDGGHGIAPHSAAGQVTRVPRIGTTRAQACGT